MFTRQNAWVLLNSHMKNRNLIRHCLAVEAVMRALSRELRTKNPALSTDEFDEDTWGIVGLLHDGDYEETKNDTSKHAHKMAGWLKDLGADQKIINGVLSHGWESVPRCPEPSNNLEWSVYTCDELTGLIVAVALVRPDKKLSTVTVDSVLKKWNIKQFAAGANRDQIALCEEKIGIRLNDFIAIALKAMQNISDELGL